MSETNEDRPGRIAEDMAAAGVAAFANNLRGLAGAVNVAACLTALAGVLLPVVVKAVSDAIKDPEVQANLSEAGGLLSRPREG
ncbi:MAG: hypothetical protein BGO49_25225 [Planctomycetales bacterium 71-10]|nr:MAG: hypothetical protein BGO49_25225 [Planctomycetales bacterium 71-10]